MKEKKVKSAATRQREFDINLKKMGKKERDIFLFNSTEAHELRTKLLRVIEDVIVKNRNEKLFDPVKVIIPALAMIVAELPEGMPIEIISLACKLVEKGGSDGVLVEKYKKEKTTKEKECKKNIFRIK